MAAIATEGLTKHYAAGGRGRRARDPGARRRHARGPRGRDLRLPRARTARARARSSGCCSGYLHATAGRATVLGLDIGARQRRDPRPDRLPARAASRCTTASPASATSTTSPSSPGRPSVRRAELCDRLELRRADPPPPDPRLQPRDAPEDRDRPGAPARPGARDPRRAVRGPRPAHAARVLRRARRAARRPGGRCSSAPTSCPRSSGCATGSPSSAPAASSRSRTWARSSRGAGGGWSCGSTGPAPDLAAVPGVSELVVEGDTLTCALEGDPRPFLAAIAGGAGRGRRHRGRAPGGRVPRAVPGPETPTSRRGGRVISGPLLRHTWRAHRLRVLVLTLALGVLGLPHAGDLRDVRRPDGGDHQVRDHPARRSCGCSARTRSACPGAVALGSVHPVALGLQLAYPVGFAAVAIAGERQRGTLEVLLSRPIKRKSSETKNDTPRQ